MALSWQCRPHRLVDDVGQQGRLGHSHSAEKLADDGGAGVLLAVLLHHEVGVAGRAQLPREVHRSAALCEINSVPVEGCQRQAPWAARSL